MDVVGGGVVVVLVVVLLFEVRLESCRALRTACDDVVVVLLCWSWSCNSNESVDLARVIVSGAVRVPFAAALVVVEERGGRLEVA